MNKLSVTACVLAMAALAAYGASSPQPAAQPAPAAGVYGERPGSSYLGVDSRDITPQRAAELKLKQEVGVEVTMVDQDAPAGKAGVREGDIIVSLNGTPMQSVEQLRRMIREIPPGLIASSISSTGASRTSSQVGKRSRSAMNATSRLRSLVDCESTVSTSSAIGCPCGAISGMP